MLLRTTALTLLFANCAYFAWSQGALAPVGLAPDSAREPQRLAQQIRPEALRVAPMAAPSEPPAPTVELKPQAASEPVPEPAAALSTAEAPAAAATCLQSGPYDTAQAEVLRRALAASGVPSSAWTLEAIAPPGRWIVYMGRYADADALERKRAELRTLRVDTAPITQPALAPGLSLGVFSSQASADEHLAQLVRRGVRTARVVADQREPSSARLRLPAADTALRERVQGLGTALAGRPLLPC